MPNREQNSNKGTFGKVLNFAGSKNYIGASYLSSLSTLKIGAGLVALASIKEVIASVSKMLPEVVYLTREDGLNKLKDYSVILIGCGLGVNNSSKKLFKNVIECIDKIKPIVIDADGLNILATLDDDFLSNKNLKCILTPHPLEAARLLNCSLKDVLNDLENSAKRLSKKYNAVVVLKTHRTIICEKDKIFINQHGNSALAKAGSGDVLAGIIAGLLAQNMDLFDASKLGVYLHSRAGELASEDLTEYCVLASEQIKYLPKAIKEIL